MSLPVILENEQSNVIESPHVKSTIIESKIEVPIFTREDVEGWLRSMDRYLKIHKIPLEE